MPETLSAKEAAAELGTDARTLRKFLRSKAQDVVEPVGQGKRYALTKGDVKKLKKKFEQWSESGSRKQKEDEEFEEAIDDIPEVDFDEDEDGMSDIEDELEPDEDDLEEIQLEELD